MKVEEGVVELAGTRGDHNPRLDSLGACCKEYYKAGDCFAKWRAALKIGPSEPPELAIQRNAQGLARYAIYARGMGLCQL